MGKRFSIITAIVACLGCLAVIQAACASDTMLMFVGEDLEVVTIASRKEEAAWSAPAIASVITRAETVQKGAATMAQALADAPGFHMNQTEKGNIPFLRGIPDGALFLFDTVPMGSGIAKSDNMIGYETSLAPVKRIEVIRGTGSVLWGADAFAGVVNAVPLSGREFQGIETGMIMSSQEAPGEAYMNWGVRSGAWASFLSVSGRYALENADSFNVVRFWNDGKTAEPVGTRYGDGSPRDSRFINVYGSVSFRDWLTFSMKLADNKNAYTVSDWDHEYAWEEQTANTTTQLKLEAVRRFSRRSGIRFSGYVKHNSQDHTYIDNTLDSGESSWYGEVIYDRSLFKDSGLVTLGGALRHDRFENLPVWDSFLPDFLSGENTAFLPRVDQIDVDNTLGSLFTQYRQDFGDIEAWAGIRYDNHDQFEDKTSYNAGLAWNMGDFIFKGLYGTAYRTPHRQADQGIGGGALEKIDNFSAQLSWKRQGIRAALTLFSNRITNHVIEDRYTGAGLSTPNNQTINGAELEFSHTLTDSLTLSGSLTLLDNSGPDETYRYLESVLTDNATGTQIKNYKDLAYAYSAGPKTMANLKAVWQISDRFTLMPELKYFSSQALYYPVQDDSRTCSDAWVADINLQVKEIFPFDLTLFVNNIFDNRYLSPGLYSVTEDNGLNAGIIVRYQW